MISRRLISQALDATDAAKSPLEQLTDRELEIFRMIGEGLTTGAIATLLFVTTFRNILSEFSTFRCGSNA